MSIDEFEVKKTKFEEVMGNDEHVDPNFVLNDEYVEPEEPISYPEYVGEAHGRPMYETN